METTEQISTFATVPTTDIEGTLRKCYDSDKYLLSKFHIAAPCFLEEAVRVTAEDLMNLPDFKMYKLYDDENGFSGYIGQEEGLDCMTGFFLMPHMRTEIGKKMFWNTVRSIFGDDFITMIHTKNTRAASFLGKEMKLEFQENDTLCFKSKKEESQCL